MHKSKKIFSLKILKYIHGKILKIVESVLKILGNNWKYSLKKANCGKWKTKKIYEGLKFSSVRKEMQSEQTLFITFVKKIKKNIWQ